MPPLAGRTGSSELPHTEITSRDEGWTLVGTDLHTPGGVTPTNPGQLSGERNI